MRIEIPLCFLAFGSVLAGKPAPIVVLASTLGTWLGELVMVSRWTDRESFKTYMKSDAHRVSHDRIDPALDAEIKLQALDHMHTFNVVAE